MKKRSRYLSVLTACVLIGIVTALFCSAGGQQGVSPSTGSGKTKVSYATWPTININDDSEIKARVEEKFPKIDIQFIFMDRANYLQGLNTRIAGGDVPDIIYCEVNQRVGLLARQGVIMELPYETVKKYAPISYNASITQIDKSVWLAALVDGKNYGLPNMQPGGGASRTNYWRKDYLDKLGVTKAPETLAEAAAVFELVRKTDLRGTGKNDVYGVTYRGKDYPEHMFQNVFAAYGVMVERWNIQKDGTVAYAFMDDRCAGALQTLREWYDKGYIDPEFPVDDNNTVLQKIAAGATAYVEIGGWNRVQPPNGQHISIAKAVNPKAEFLLSPPLKGPNGDSGYVQFGIISSSLTFGKHLEKDPAKLAFCLQFLDFINADTPEAAYIRWGVEGKDYERDKVTGAVVTLHKNPEALAKSGYSVLEASQGIPNLTSRFLRNDDAQYSIYARTGNIQPEISYPTWIGFFADSAIASISGEVNPILFKGFIDIITGKRPVSDFNAIRQEWNRAGGEKLTAEMNRAYKQGRPYYDNIMNIIK